jgi:transposase
MLTLPPSVRIYVAADRVDMRLGIDGLMAIVQGQWQEDPYTGHLFVFLGKRGDKIKILFFDQGGFVLYYKRLEKGTFRWPAIQPGMRSVEMESTDLAMLLSGIDWTQVRRPKRWVPPVRRATTSEIATPPAP